MPCSWGFFFPDGSQPTNSDRFRFSQSRPSPDRERIRKHYHAWIIHPLFRGNYCRKLDCIDSFLVWSCASWSIIALARGDSETVPCSPMVVDCNHGDSAAQDAIPGSTGEIDDGLASYPAGHGPCQGHGMSKCGGHSAECGVWFVEDAYLS